MISSSHPFASIHIILSPRKRYESCSTIRLRESPGACVYPRSGLISRSTESQVFFYRIEPSDLSFHIMPRHYLLPLRPLPEAEAYCVDPRTCEEACRVPNCDHPRDRKYANDWKLERRSHP